MSTSTCRHWMELMSMQNEKHRVELASAHTQAEAQLRSAMAAEGG